MPFVADADHPAVLVGADNGPTPVEYLLHALAACLTAGIGNIAAVRGVTLDVVESVVEGDIDLLGLLGPRTRRSATAIRASAPASRSAATRPPEKLARSSSSRRARSAVFDVLTNGVPVTIEVDTELSPSAGSPERPPRHPRRRPRPRGCTAGSERHAHAPTP